MHIHLHPFRNQAWLILMKQIKFDKTLFAIEGSKIHFKVHNLDFLLINQECLKFQTKVYYKLRVYYKVDHF
jgi:hypothetical protein